MCYPKFYLQHIYNNKISFHAIKLQLCIFHSVNRAFRRFSSEKLQSHSNDTFSYFSFFFGIFNMFSGAQYCFSFNGVPWFFYASTSRPASQQSESVLSTFFHFTHLIRTLEVYQRDFP